MSLPWVDSAIHLGHRISENGSMNDDCDYRRYEFLRKSSKIINEFENSDGNVLLNLINIYACSFYGSNIWDFGSEDCANLFRSWNKVVKNAWAVPPNAHNYFVGNLLGVGHHDLKSSIFKRFISFVQRLLNSKKPIVSILSMISTRDVRSIIGKNISVIRSISGHNCVDRSASHIFHMLPGHSVPQMKFGGYFIFKNY